MNVDETQILPSILQWVDDLTAEILDAPAKMGEHQDAILSENKEAPL